MAPIATQNGGGVAEETQAYLKKGGVGGYKEQAGGLAQYDKKLEEEGDATRPKANVSSISNLSAHALTRIIVCKLPAHLEPRGKVSTVGALRSH